MSSEESESSLEDGFDKSSFRCLWRFFFFLIFFFFGTESDDDESDESDEDRSGSRFTFGSYFLLHFELSTDRVIWSSSWVVSNRVPIFSTFSLSNTSLVSNYKSLINFRYANFSLIVSTSPCVSAVLTSLSVGIQTPSWSATLVATLTSLRWPTLSVCMGG